jgi:hypothetical protein
MRLFRLEQKEEKQIKKAQRMKEGMDKWQRENPDARRRAYGRCQTWSYQHDKGVVVKKQEDE